MERFDWWTYAWWWAINIPVPVVLPLLVLYAFGRFGTTPPSTHHALKSIGKGELFWAAMAMAAATGSELFTLREGLVGDNLKGIAALSIFVMIIVILFSVLLVGLGSMMPAPPSGSHIPNKEIFWASVGTLVFTIVAYSASHLVVMAQDSSAKVEEQQKAKDEKDAILKKIRDCLAGSKNRASQLRCVEDTK